MFSHIVGFDTKIPRLLSTFLRLTNSCISFIFMGITPLSTGTGLFPSCITCGNTAGASNIHSQLPWNFCFTITTYVVQLQTTRCRNIRCIVSCGLMAALVQYWTGSPYPNIQHQAQSKLSGFQSLHNSHQVLVQDDTAEIQHCDWLVGLQISLCQASWHVHKILLAC